MAEHKNVGDHVEDLADGRMFAPGETFDLDDESQGDYLNKDKIDREVFITTGDEGKPGKPKTTREKVSE